MSKLKVKNKQLAKLREFRKGMDPAEFLSTEFRQITRALQNSFVETGSEGSIFGTIGEIKMWAGAQIPSNAFSCDGTSLSATEYPDLAAVLWDQSTQKWAWGGTGVFPDGNFNLPDMRGVVPRGVTGSSTKDPDSATRVVMNTGGNTGNSVGSYQTDEFASHNHTISVFNTGGGTVVSQGSGALVSSTQTTGNRGGNETRMKNAYVNFIIIYQ